MAWQIQAPGTTPTNSKAHLPLQEQVADVVAMAMAGKLPDFSLYDERVWHRVLPILEPTDMDGSEMEEMKTSKKRKFETLDQPSAPAEEEHEEKDEMEGITTGY